MNTYARFPLVFARGNGTLLYDDDDNEYLDFAAGIATCRHANNTNNTKLLVSVSERLF